MIKKVVLLRVDEGIATVTLSDGDRMNPIGEQLIAELSDVIGKLRRDDSIRGLILTAQGKGFCVGADLAHYLQMIEEPSSKAALSPYIGQLMDDMNRVIEQLKTFPAPVLCVLNGVAAGGGVGLALAGDLVIAARSAYFYLPFVPVLGIVPDMGSTWSLPRAIGRQRALGLTLTGKKLPAQMAQEWGLIWDCVADEDLEREAVRLMQQLASMPRHAIHEARQIFAQSESNTLTQQLSYERERQMELVSGDSFTDGVLSFAGRQPAKTSASS